MLYLFLLLKASCAPKFHSNYNIHILPSDKFITEKGDKNFDMTDDNSSGLAVGNQILTSHLHNQYIQKLIVAEHEHSSNHGSLDEQLNGSIIPIHCNFHGYPIDEIVFTPQKGDIILCSIKYNQEVIQQGVIEIEPGKWETNKIDLEGCPISIVARVPRNQNNT